MLEIEIKVKVPNLAPVRSKLDQIGASHSEHLTEQDMYYNAPHRDFGETDEALRLRTTSNGVTLTYKGKREIICGSKVRKEYNLSVEAKETAHEIFTHLGFIPVAEVNKERDYYVFEDFSIALDDVSGLGTFVEIELVCEEEKDAKEAVNRIASLAEKIGVTGESISDSYLELILHKREVDTP
ncbi:MAG: class IV adenylate cyclase [Methanomicrobiales archaeon]|jgi:adenylate cyclase class 2|nr:class IV adenylate cyclase [Methanomicrobiales archaeon]